MKILFTHETFPPEYTGGGEFLVLKLATLLTEKGHSVKVLTTGNPNIKKYQGIQTIRLPINRYAMNLSLPFVLAHAKDADLIVTSSGNSCFPSWLAAKILDKPIICYVHHIFGPHWRTLRGYFFGSVFELMEKIFISRSYDAIVFQNESSIKLGLNIGVEKKRIHLVQPGIEFEKYQMKSKKKHFVLFVGNMKMDKPMCRLKGLENFIEAARKLPEISFVVVGKGDYLDELKKDSPSNISFLGVLFGKKLIRLYNEALVFCLPSLNEGFGLAILEAMASGCAVVSSIDLGQKGRLIKSGSSKEIEEGIRYYFNNPQKAVSDGRKNRSLAKKFTWDRFINSFIRIYEVLTK